MCRRIWKIVFILVIAECILQVVQGNELINVCIRNVRLNECFSQCITRHGQEFATGYLPYGRGGGNQFGPDGGIGRITEGGISGIGPGGRTGPWSGSTGPLSSLLNDRSET
ncbi:uncharacterized protein [Fopius arisanus]|uniref:Uncharacterized protein n=1 Tax=Fopius arisanus TaxID=64838 RepID=A0A9R1TRS2_9HYME|nr:PREDICTED: uncharacterized protein LOC105273377 [Fopius arisanus]